MRIKLKNILITPHGKLFPNLAWVAELVLSFARPVNVTTLRTLTRVKALSVSDVGTLVCTAILL